MQSLRKQLIGDINEKLNNTRQHMNEEIRQKCLGNNNDPNEELNEKRDGLSKELIAKVAEALKKRIEKNPIKEDVMYF